jgi:hypothetical protein
LDLVESHCGYNFFGHQHPHERRLSFDGQTYRASTPSPSCRPLNAELFEALREQHVDQPGANAVSALLDAFSNNDGEAFLALVPRKGLRLDGRRKTKKALLLKLAQAPLHHVLGMCLDLHGKPTDCAEDGFVCDEWREQGTHRNKIEVLNGSGYGDQRLITLRRSRKNGWRVVSIYTADMGAP